MTRAWRAGRAARRRATRGRCRCAPASRRSTGSDAALARSAQQRDQAAGLRAGLRRRRLAPAADPPHRAAHAARGDRGSTDDLDVVEEEASIAIEQVERLTRVVDDLHAAAPGGGTGRTDAVRVARLDASPRCSGSGSRRSQQARRSIHVRGERGLASSATPGALSQVLATLIENSLMHGGGTVDDPRPPQPAPRSSSRSATRATACPTTSPRTSSSARSPSAGTGLGLALARDLAEPTVAGSSSRSAAAGRLLAFLVPKRRTRTSCSRAGRIGRVVAAAHAAARQPLGDRRGDEPPVGARTGTRAEHEPDAVGGDVVGQRAWRRSEDVVRESRHATAMAIPPMLTPRTHQLADAGPAAAVPEGPVAVADPGRPGWRRRRRGSSPVMGLPRAGRPDRSAAG